MIYAICLSILVLAVIFGIQWCVTKEKEIEPELELNVDTKSNNSTLLDTACQILKVGEQALATVQESISDQLDQNATALSEKAHIKKATKKPAKKRLAKKKTTKKTTKKKPIQPILF